MPDSRSTYNHPSLAPLDSPESYLGTDPVCDICLSPIAVGDYVQQTYVGPVIEDRDGALGVKEQMYQLVHTACLRKDS